MAVNTFEENSTVIDHESYSADANDTSVILVSGGADLDLSYVDVVKYGYASDLLSASFWGFNAAVNVVCFYFIIIPQSILNNVTSLS